MWLTDKCKKVGGLGQWLDLCIFQFRPASFGKAGRSKLKGYGCVLIMTSPR